MELMHHVIKHGLNEGVKISYAGFSIDIIVRDICGSASAKEAVIELKGTSNDRDIFLEYSDLVALEHDIKFEVNKERKISGKRIEIRYIIPEHYGFHRRKYKPREIRRVLN